MQYDYYAVRKEQLSETLNELERAKVELDRAKQSKDKNARQQAEKKIEQAAEKGVKVEPHLSYLWYEAQGSELKNSIRDAWQKHLNASIIPDAFHFTPDISALNHLPSLSFMLRVPFKLRKPYLSKDDRTFHLLDNPVRKDKVFQTPMVASTSWKGALRSTFWQLKSQKEIEITDKDIERLFGNERQEEDHQKLKSGRLYFYPTFFDKLGLEVINPHSRKTGTGKNPILIECVPAYTNDTKGNLVSTTGELVILYVPFEEVQTIQVAEDLKLVAEGVKEMLSVYGFGAKTSSGFGIIEDQLNLQGKLAIQADLPALKQPESETKQPEPEPKNYLTASGQIQPDFLTPNGSFKSKEEYLQGKSDKKGKISKKWTQLYDKAKKWWDSEQLKLTETAETERIPEPEPLPKSTITEVSFDKLSELCDRAQTIAQNLGTS
jgi:CRISPR-associated protein Cmr2